jgi:hypothetical protein
LRTSGFSFLTVLEVFLGCFVIGYGYLPAASAQAPTYTYTYTGGPLGGCAGCKITGSVTLSQPLSAYLGTSSTASKVPFLVSYSFSAGGITINNSNSIQFATLVAVQTDGFGKIVYWRIQLLSSEGEISSTGYNDSLIYLPSQQQYSGNAGTWGNNTTGDIRAEAAPFTSAQSVGPITITWNEPFPDTNYTAVCSVEAVTLNASLPIITARSPDSITVNPTPGGSLGGTLNCLAVPDTDVSGVLYARQTFSGSPPILTASWSPNTAEDFGIVGPYTPVCTLETQDKSPSVFTGVITSVSGAISVVNSGFADGTIHCIEVPDTSQDFGIIRGSRTQVAATPTVPITWDVAFPDANYVAACSDVVLGAAGSDSAIAISAGSKTPGSMLVIPAIPAGTVDCVALPRTVPPSPPLRCPVNASTVFPFAGGNKSTSGLPTAMLATFSPSTAGAPISLDVAANACDVTGFDWQQTVVHLPGPFADANGIALTTPFNDPPEAGYAYMLSNQNPNLYAQFYQAYPFYYNPSIIPIGCAIGNGVVCTLPITSANGQTLNFFDSPRWTDLPTGGYIGFTTSLVGVLANNAIGPVLFQWSWESTYNENTGGVQIQTASSEPVDGSGTGGLKITSINGAPQTPPVATCVATPNTLWPPNGKSVLVTVSGNITAGTSALAAAAYSVNDEYGLVQPSGSITLGAGGSYSFGLSLIAARNGSDLDGRTYTIIVRGDDTLGNVGVCSAVVTVPHDQGH